MEPEPEPEAVVVEAESEPEMTPEDHIAALMAKIRPQRGRLPIPDYEEVDHAAILQMPSRDRGSLHGDPLSDPLPVAADEAAELSTVDEPVESASVTQPTYEQPTSSEPAAAWIPEQPAPVVAERVAVPVPAMAHRDEEPPVNGSSKSSWLSTDEQDRAWTSTEVEAGWKRADTVAETHDESTNDSGLPVRRPGARLVPGSVTKPVGAAGRDPEAIRARLSAHKAGVRRGRTTSVPSADQ